MLGAFQFLIIDADYNVLNWLIRLAIAAICGFAIGMERKSRSKEAGIRTHTIVCFASALMMVVSKYAFADVTEGLDATLGTKYADPARIAAQVVSGIGFIGAGIIFYKKDIIHGLTTAAGIWATAGIGLAIGSGMIIIGVVSSVLLICLQIFLHSHFKIFKSKINNFLKMTVILQDADTIDKITSIFGIKRMLKFRTVTLETGEIRADIEAITEHEFTAKELFEFTNTYDFIKNVEKTDEP